MPKIHTDERRLKQVLVNLIKNAMQCTSTGYIEINASIEEKYLSGKMLRVSVQDTGRGIEEDQTQRIFARFGKQYRSACINSASLGLGLPITQKIIKHAGGNIMVQSEGEGKGSTFTFTMKVSPKVNVSQEPNPL